MKHVSGNCAPKSWKTHQGEEDMLDTKRSKRTSRIGSLRRRKDRLYGVSDEKSSALGRFLQKTLQILGVGLSLQHKSASGNSQMHQFASRYAEKLHIDARRHQPTQVDGVFARRFTVTITSEMADRLEEERKRRFLDSVPETIRTILSEYLSNLTQSPNQT